MSIDEIAEAMSALTPGKTAGPDSLPIDLYKYFKDKLITPLYEKFLESYTNGYLSPSMREVLIILLPKPGKANNKCENMRQISLINTDTKILSKFLARRPEVVVTGIVGDDQNRFIKGRQGFHNVMAEWPYLFKVIDRFRFGETFYK